MSSVLQTAYDRLHAAFGPQHWWPADTPFEVMLGAVLTQNTSWKNVEKAIANLRDAGLLHPASLRRVPTEELAELIRPAGYFRLKARRLHNLIEFLFRQYDGCLESMFATALETLRELLLEINGIGPETADSILLYAGNMPTFVVDAYTARVLKRHGWIEPEADYHAIKDHFEGQLPQDTALFNEYHALLVRVGKEFCGPTPRCEACPLRPLLPEGGPLAPGT